MVLVAATSAIHVSLIRPALDDIFLKKDQSMLILLPVAVIAIAIVKGLSAYFQNYFMRYVGQRVITDMQIKLYEHLISADLTFLNSQSSGRLISRFTNDIITMRGAVSNLLTGLVKEFLTVIFLIALMFYQNFTLSIIAFTVFPLAVFPIVKMGKRMRKISNSTQEELGKYTSRLDDTFQTIRIIRSYGREAFEIKRARDIMENIFRLYIKAIKTDSITSPIMEMLGGIAIAAVIWYGGSQVISGNTTPGSFFAFIAAFITAYKPIKSLADLNTSLQEGLAAARRLFAVLDIKPSVCDAENSVDLTIKGGAIKFNKVSFSYLEGKQALKGLDFIVPAGKKVALVGASGGGKSTIINLILRFYDTEDGFITIDEQDIKKVKLTSLRSAFAIVTQEIMLFDDSVMANIGYGNLTASEEEIINAAKAAAAHDFIMELPNGYDSLIGQHGLKLSGGQRQRISIARAILKNAPILLLDEATSALDPIAEQQIQDALENLRQNKTTLVVAHRLSTIIDADIIYTIKDGRIVESGTHQQLLNLNAEYANLYKKQLSDISY
jgi:subfamily B ATP-binding cassette protein MsbA